MPSGLKKLIRHSSIQLQLINLTAPKVSKVPTTMKELIDLKGGVPYKVRWYPAKITEKTFIKCFGSEQS